MSVKLNKSQSKNVRQRNNYRTWLFVIIRIRLSNHYIKYNIISKIWICHIKLISGCIRIDWIYMTTNMRLRLSFSSTGLPKNSKQTLFSKNLGLKQNIDSNHMTEISSLKMLGFKTIIVYISPPRTYTAVRGWGLTIDCSPHDSNDGQSVRGGLVYTTVLNLRFGAFWNLKV